MCYEVFKLNSKYSIVHVSVGWCTYHVCGFECAEEAAGLLVVRVGGEGDIINGALKGQLLTRHRHNVLRLRQNRLKTCSTHVTTLPANS